MKHIKLGIFYGVISALSFAVMSVLVKEIGQELPTSMLVFFRFAISFILLLPWIITDPHFTLKVIQPFRYFIRILASLSALSCIFYALKFMPLTDALLLTNTAPLFVPIIVWLLVGAKIPKKASLGVILGFLGVGIILQPDKAIFSMPALLALAGGFLSGFAIVQMRLISKTSTVKQMLFYYFLVSTLVTGVIVVLQWQTPATIKIWLMLLGIGILGTLYQVFATLSYAAAPVRLMSPLIFLIVVFGSLFDWLLWGHIPTFITIIGALFVIMGVIITVYFGQKEILK